MSLQLVHYTNEQLKQMRQTFGDASFNQLFKDAYREDTVTHYDPGYYVYYGDFVVSLGQRPDQSTTVRVNRVWADDELIYDRVAGFQKPGTAFQFFDGNESQGVVYRDMNYRGLMCLVFRNFNVTDYNDRYPAISVEIADGPSTDYSLNSVGDMLFRDRGTAETAAFFPEADALLRVIYRETAPDVYQPVFDRARLSSKLQNLETVVKAPAFARSSPAVLVFAYMPDQNKAILQNPTNPTLKSLVDLSTGESLQDFANPIAETIVPFTIGGVTYVLFAAADTYSVGIIKDGTVLPLAAGSFPAPLRSVVVGLERNPVNTAFKSRDLYIVTAGAIYQFEFMSDGNALNRSINNVGAGEFTQAFFDARRFQLHAVIDTLDGNARVRTLGNFLNGLQPIRGHNLRNPTIPNPPPATVVGNSQSFPAPEVKSIRDRTFEAANRSENGTLAFSTWFEDTVAVVTLSTGVAQTVSLDPDNDMVIVDRPFFWDGNTFVAFTPAAKYTAFGTEAGTDRLTAETVMRTFARYAGFDADEITTIGLNGLFIDGYIAPGGSTLGQIASNLGQFYGFNWLEQAGHITFKANYTPTGELSVDVIIPIDRLAVLDEGNGDYLTIHRSDDQDYPVSVSISYFDKDNEFKRGYQKQERTRGAKATTKSTEPLDMTLPLTIDGTYARQLLSKLLYDAWGSKVLYTIRVPSDFLNVEGGDVARFTAYGMQFTGLVTQSRLNADNSVSLILQDVSLSNYPLVVDTQPTVTLPGKGALPVKTVILDLPDRNPSQTLDRQVNILVLMAGYSPGKFKGAAFDWSETLDDNWQTKAVIGVEDESYIGSLKQPMPGTKYPYEMDTVTRIYVDLGTIPETKMNLLPLDGIEVDPEENLIAVGEGADVELIQFYTATQISGSVWMLSDLLRGRFGTDIYIRDRLAGEPVSMLDKVSIVRVDYDAFSVGTQYKYRSYSAGQPTWQLDVNQYVPEGQSRKPYAPVVTSVERDMSGNLIIRFAPRARFTNSPPILDWLSEYVPDEPNPISFVVEIPISGGGVRNLLAEGTPNVVYSLMDQYDDGFSGMETLLDFTILQGAPQSIGRGMERVVIDEPIYPVGTARLSGRISGGGDLDGNTTNALFLTGTMEAGGAITGDIAEYIDLSLRGTLAAGGSIAGRVVSPVALVGSVAAGGSIVGTVGVRKLLSAALEAGGALSGAVERRFLLSGAVAGEGSLAGSALVYKLLVGTVAGEGTMFGDIEEYIAGGTHRYWGIEFTHRAGQSVGVAEITMSEEPGGPNLLTGITAQAANWYLQPSTEFGPANATDNNFGTKLVVLNSNPVKRVWVDLGTPKAVNDFGWRNASTSPQEYPTSLTFVYSDDGVTWETLFTAPNTDAKGWVSNTYRVFENPAYVAPPKDATAHRWWALRPLVANGSNAMAVAELELRETVGGPNVASNAVGVAQSNTTYDTNAGFGPQRAFDGSNATKYAGVGPANAANNQLLAFRFNTARTIRQLGYRAANDYPIETPTSFEVVWSDNGYDWTVDTTVTGFTGLGQSELRLVNLANA